MGSASFYPLKPNDEHAIFLTPGAYGIVGDGKTDDTAAIQAAITDMKQKLTFGIVYLPEGKYLISDTIYIPKAIRLIGYGAERPEIILKEHAPGYDCAYPEDKGNSKYMIWFVGKLPDGSGTIFDANPGTFYSALSNIDLTIGAGNPHAVAIRSHFAQHGFIAHSRIDATHGHAGVFDIGNEMEDVTFIGGDYGIHTTKPSPGWPFVMVDCVFEGQRKAAVKSSEAGLTIVRMTARNTPIAIDSIDGYYEKLYLENSRFENISDCLLHIRLEENSLNQWNVRDTVCKNVPCIARFESGKTAAAPAAIYAVDTFVHGVQIHGLGAEPVLETTVETHPLAEFPPLEPSDLLPLPENVLLGQSQGARRQGRREIR